MPFGEINKHLERTLKKNIDDEILVAYKTYKSNSNILLQLAVEGKPIYGPVTPTILEERRTKFKEHVLQCYQSEKVTIDLISLPKVEENNMCLLMILLQCT